MKGQYKIGEVENILGITRSAIRHYIEKGLIDISKDESNGYRYYERENINDLIEIAYYRNNLDLSLDDIATCFHAKTLEEYRAVFVRQRKLIEERMRQEQNYLELIDTCDEGMNDFIRYRGKIKLMEYDKPKYCYYYNSEAINVHSALFVVSYPANEFGIKDGKLTFKRPCYFVDEKDPLLLDEEGIVAAKRVIKSNRFVYAPICSEKSSDDPSLLEPAIAWAAKNGIELGGQYYLCSRFADKREGKRQHYYEVLLPVK